jgi:acetyl-CoA C-acetyltransferase
MSASAPSYIVAARRSAIGRVGGLHKTRRLDDLSSPVLMAALKDSGLSPESVEALLLGNTMAGGNPARTIGLSAGLPETAFASTVDSQGASGLDAILAAARLIGSGDAQVVVAGGAESLSTAPWRISRPRNPHQLPHFIGVEPAVCGANGDGSPFEASEILARQLRIDRGTQDAYALKCHLRVEAARDAKRFVGEIVAIRNNAVEARDECAPEPTPDDLADMTPFQPGNDDLGGTLTPGNTSALADGAAFVVMVSESIWTAAGRPPALQLRGAALIGVGPGLEAKAASAAMQKLLGRAQPFDRTALLSVETSEASAAQAIAFTRALDLDEAVLNPDGGAIARGHPMGAAGAVSVVRLFSRLVRQSDGRRPRFGAAAQGAIGGLGIAALFEAVG